MPERPRPIAEGGTTPTIGFVRRAAVEAGPLGLQVLIRALDDDALAPLVAAASVLAATGGREVHLRAAGSLLSASLVGSSAYDDGSHVVTDARLAAELVGAACSM